MDEVVIRHVHRTSDGVYAVLVSDPLGQSDSTFLYFKNDWCWMDGEFGNVAKDIENQLERKLKEYLISSMEDNAFRLVLADVIRRGKPQTHDPVPYVNAAVSLRKGFIGEIFTRQDVYNYIGGSTRGCKTLIDFWVELGVIRAINDKGFCFSNEYLPKES